MGDLTKMQEEAIVQKDEDKTATTTSALRGNLGIDKIWRQEHEEQHDTLRRVTSRPYKTRVIFG